jgi:signal transduction histidine kinase
MVVQDYRLLFERAPSCLLVLGVDEPRYTILDATDAYLGATLTTRDIVARSVFEVFPDSSVDPHPTGVRNLNDSFKRVLASKAPHTMPVQRYDIRDGSGSFVERYWTPVNAPVLSNDGALLCLINRVEDVTEFVKRGAILENEATRLENEILLHARQVAVANRALEEEAIARETLLAIVGHDFRSPLSAIRQAAYVLARSSTTADDWSLRLLLIIEASVTRMDRMLHDLPRT